MAARSLRRPRDWQLTGAIAGDYRGGRARRLSTDWECWVIYEDVTLDEQERRPILRHDESLSRVAGLFGLPIF